MAHAAQTQVAAADQFRAAAFVHENACNCCDSAADRADTLREALRHNPVFIGEAIGNGDLANLIEGFQKADTQQCWDAIHDLVTDHLAMEEKRVAGRPVDSLEALCRLFGVAA